MQTLDAKELGIVVGVYFFVLLITWLLVKFLNVGRGFWSLFSSSTARLVGILLLTVTVVSITLFYNDWIAYIVAPLMFIIALLLLGFNRGRHKTTAISSVLIAILVLVVAAPIGLTLWKRDSMTPEISGTVGGLIGMFWLFSLLMVVFIPGFKEDSKPFAHSRTLILILSLCFYCLLFVSKDYGVALIAVFGALALLVWILNARQSNKVWSKSLNTYQRKPFETALIVMTLIFAVTLNLVIGITKKTNLQNQPVYIFNFITFVAMVMVLGTILLIVGLNSWNTNSKMRTVKREMAQTSPTLTEKTRIKQKNLGTS